MSKKDFQLIMILIVISVMGLIAGRYVLHRPQAETHQAVIYLNDEEYMRVPLNDPRIVLIEQNEFLNEVQVFEDGFSMLSASCENQHCVHQGEVTLENMDKRFLGAWIYCLPNKVSIELIRGE